MSDYEVFIFLFTYVISDDQYLNRRVITHGFGQKRGQSVSQATNFWSQSVTTEDRPARDVRVEFKLSKPAVHKYDALKQSCMPASR